LQTDKLIERVSDLSPYFEEAVHNLKGCNHVTDIRNYGLAAGFNIDPIAGEPGLRPYQIAMKMWQKGFYVRYGGATIQLGLPFTSEREEIDRLLSALGETFNEVG